MNLNRNVSRSKDVWGLEVYQVDNDVRIGIGTGVGSVVASKTYNNIPCASRAYNRLKTDQKTTRFMRQNSL
jgi:hypothetical protein